MKTKKHNQCNKFFTGTRGLPWMDKILVGNTEKVVRESYHVTFLSSNSDFVGSEESNHQLLEW